MEATHLSAKLLFLSAVLTSTMALAGGVIALTPLVSAKVALAASLLPDRAVQSLDGETKWLNSPPLTAESLRGKVVLVDFWTYSCINWRREFPYVRAWFDKYKSQGLVVIGVHSPEFAFEKNVDNIRRAVKDIGVGYPVVIDSDHRIWRAFGNQYWPALYFIDAKGKIRAHQFGEGDYARSERIIQQLLSEAGSPATNSDLVVVDAQGAEAAADWKNLQSPENYVGYARTQYFASPGGVAPDRRQRYAVPPKLAAGEWALSGDWTMSPESASLQAANGRIVYRFQARDLHLVMGPGPATRAAPMRFRVRIDGKPPGASHGVDVDEQGNGTLDYQRMYQLIRQAGPVVDRLFEIEFLDPGAEAFSFSFG